MKRQVSVVGVTALTTFLGALAAASPAAAAGPQIFHTKVNISLTGIDVCGFTVDSLIRGVDTTEVFVDRSGNVLIQDLARIVSTLTNEANGHVVHVENSGRDAFQPSPVVNPDGTLTATDILTGSPARIYTSKSQVLVKDVGFLSIVDTVDADGNLINEQVVVHGVHQVSGPDDPAYCAAITSALG